MLRIKRRPIHYVGHHVRHQFIRVIQYHGPREAHQICWKNIMQPLMLVVTIYKYDSVTVRCQIRCRETFTACKDLPNDATVLRDAIRHVLHA